jgi:hypothetical protein
MPQKYRPEITGKENRMQVLACQTDIEKRPKSAAEAFDIPCTTLGERKVELDAGMATTG